MRSLFFPQNINGVLTSRTTRHSVRGGDGKGYYCARSAKKNVLPQPLTFLGRGGGNFFQIFEKTSYFWNSITSMDPY